MKASDLLKRCRIDKGDKFKLADFQADDDLGTKIDEAEGKAMLAEMLEKIHKLQEVMYAEGLRSILIVLQGMDTGGKDGIIEHVVGSINPQGTEVHAFKAPNSEETDHNFLWRAARRLPARGKIGVFNRSYYEDVIVVRVHPEYLAKQKMPPSLIGKDIWDDRFKDIRGFEKHLTRNGTTVVKIFLNLSHGEQRKRLLARMDDPEKQWKFSPGDIAERALWPKYMDAYQDAIHETATDEAPWYIVPADRKWFARLAAAAIILETLEKLDLKSPKADAALLQEIEKARKTLTSET